MINPILYSTLIAVKFGLVPILGEACAVNVFDQVKMKHGGKKISMET